jgi:predicted dehydrogenase
MKKVKVGIIGVGRMGQYHLNIFSGLSECEIVGICDVDENKLINLSDRYNVPAYDDYKKLVKKSDALCIATPTSTHYEIAKFVLESGKHLLLEKPMTNNYEQAEELVEISKKKNLVFQIGHIERFNGAVQQLKNIIFHPYYIECRRLSPYDPRISDVGVVLDLMIHDIDIILNLIEDEISEINSLGNFILSKFEDVATTQILFKNGCIAHLIASRISQKKERTLIIMQKDSYVFLDYNTQDIEIHRRATSAYLLTPEEIRYSQEAFVEHLSIQKDNPLKLEDLHFLNCITKKEKPIVENEQNLYTLKISLQIIEQINKFRKNE